MPQSSEDIFVARQPILCRNNTTVGYELLFRNGASSNFAEIDSDISATSNVIINSLMGFGLQNLVGDSKAFINFSTEFVTGMLQPCFSSDSVVIEVLERIDPTPEVINYLQEMKQQGYVIALDDFVFKKEYVPFLKIADIVKIEVNNKDQETLSKVVEKIKKVTNIELLAEKVETQEVYDACYEAGFDYFQGYFFAKPQMMQGQKLSVSNYSMLMLLKEITNEEVGLHELEGIIEKDIALSHKLMKMACNYRSSKMPDFDTVKQILQLFGLKRVKSWVLLISLVSASDILPEVFRMAFIRASFMRSVAMFKSYENCDSYYTVGMFSYLDTIMKRPMTELLDDLPISESMKNGILNGEGQFGEVLAIAKSYEEPLFDTEMPQEYQSFYLQATQDAVQFGNLQV